MMKKIICLILFIFCGLQTFSQSACNNEDFEDAGLTYTVPKTVTISTTNGITGWVAAAGNNSVFPQNQSSCVQAGCCPDTTGLLVVEIGTNSAGYIDPYIGSSYPIYSVFGNGTNNGTALNGFNCSGNWFVKLNNWASGAGITQITKTFFITSSNTNFKYSFISITQTATPGSHCCCDNSGISVTFEDCLGNPLATTSQFSVSPDAGGSCSAIGPCTSGPIISFLPASNPAWIYNKWKVDSIDLSAWLSTCITIRVRVFDCAYQGHAGYSYFDAQCGPLLTTNISLLNHSSYLKVYPNPNAGNFNIDISKEIFNGEIEIQNILGQSVHKQNIKQGTNSIKIENLAKGIYNYSVLQNKEVVSVGKIVIE